MPTEPAVVEQMQTLVHQWEETANSKAIFLRCYLMMTNNTLVEIQQKKFGDPAWVNNLLHHFADYYFVALRAYKKDPLTASTVWQLTFGATLDPHTLPIQNLLLGVNAHINYDLVFAVADLLKPEWNELSDEQRASRYSDYCRINDIIAKTIDVVQDQVLEPAMPEIGIIDKLLGGLDELLISRLITDWRETVWKNTCRLLDTSDDGEYATFAQEIEEEALKLGRLIYRGKR